jgi:hypothetical protein
MPLTQFLLKPNVSRAREVGRRVMPYASLALGSVSAFLMDRSDGVVGRLLGFLIGGWVLGIVAVVASAAETRRLQEPLELRKKTGMFVRIRRGAAYTFAERTAVQICLSQALFFPLPAYARSFVPTAPQILFMALLGVACTVVLVDALFNRVYEMRRTFVMLMAFSGFVALQFALPTALGMTLHRTLEVSVAACVLSAGIPGLVEEWQWGFQMARRLVLWALALVLGLVLAALNVPGPMLPGVPLRVTEAVACNGVVDHQPVGAGTVLVRDVNKPAPISCFTALRIPRGLKDTLHHVWWHNGRVVDRITVPVVGNRQDEYRAYSRKQNLGTTPVGQWRCELRADAGQVLGAVDFEVRAMDSAPAAPGARRRGH